MATPYDDLPLPSADEYPYNLQGDQTKARALAEAARAGNSSALERLRTLGLDDSGNLAPYTPDLDGPDSAAASEPRLVAPSGGGGSGYRPGSSGDLASKKFEEDKRRWDAQQAENKSRYEDQKARADRQEEENKRRYEESKLSSGGSAADESQRRFNEQLARQKEQDAENKRRWDQSNTQNQSKDSRDFAESQRRFNEQTAMAKQRQNFQEQQAREKAAADKAAAAQKAQQAAQKGGGGGGKGQEPKAPKAPKGGGGGGGGGRGGGRQQRSTGKFDQSNSTMGDRSYMDTGTPAAWNKEGGLGRSGLKAPGSQWGAETNAATNAKLGGPKGNAKNAAAGVRNKWQNQGPRTAAEVDQYNREMAAANAKGEAENQAARDRHAAEVARRRKEGTLGNYDETGILPDEEEQKQPKMTHAYGNKYAGMVRARGDLA